MNGMQAGRKQLLGTYTLGLTITPRVGEGWQIGLE